MATEVSEWEAVYRGEAGFDGEPPWNIGEPQPELAALMEHGRIRSDVLDAGCGYAELSLALAAQGHTVVGIDVAPTAIAVATEAAHRRGISTATFVCDDITTFSGYDGRFNTIVDSTLFHALPIEARHAYLRAVHDAAAPGATFYMLVFATGAFPPDVEYKPFELTESELREALSERWVIDEIRPAAIHAYLPTTGAKVRQEMSAHLLTAHKAG